MTLDQIIVIENELGLQNQPEPKKVELILAGSTTTLTGDYVREENSTLVKITRGIYTQFVDLESIVSIGAYAV